MHGTMRLRTVLLCPVLLAAVLGVIAEPPLVASGQAKGRAPKARVRGAAAPLRTPLSTKGSAIVDADGRRVVLQGINWFGFETSNHVVHGLWTRDYKDMLRQVRDLGFNTIRLPFSIEAVRSSSLTGVDFSAGKNADLKGATPLQAMDRVIHEAGRLGLLVLLDNHSGPDNGYMSPLWYGGGYTEADWVDTWRLMAKRYRDAPNVIGADLKNEPHGEASWGDGGATDWRRAAERAGDAVLALAPKWLVVVEGIERGAPGQRLATHWWGGDLEGVRTAPVRLARPGRLVYSPHEYGPGVFMQPWFTRPDMAAELVRRWQTGFGFIASQGIAPVLVGEFGGHRIDAQSLEGRWQRQFLDYLGDTGISWAYWSLNPDSGDTGGVLKDDWTSVDEAKVAQLQKLMGRRSGGLATVDGDAPEPAPVTGPAPTASTTPAPVSTAPSSPAPSGPVSARFVVESRWNEGFCGHVEVSGDAALGGRSIALTLPVGARLTQVWNADGAGQSGRLSLRLPAWARASAATPYGATGFCASGAGAPTDLAVL